MKSMNRQVRRVTTLLATLSAIGWAGPVLAQHPNNPVGGSLSSVNGQTVTITYPPYNLTTAGAYEVSSWGSAPISYGTPAVTAANFVPWANANPGQGSGYVLVDSAHETLRASATVASMAGKATENTNQASFGGTEIVVGAGSSGLSAGAPVTLRFNLRVDGTQSVGLNNQGQPALLPATYAYSAQAYTMLSYNVFDLDQSNEGTVLAFQYEANMQYGVDRRYNSDLGDHFTYLTDRHSSSAQYMTDGGWISGHYDVDGVVLADITGLAIAGVPTSRTRSFDTGVITIDLDTYVGHTLMISASLTSRALGEGIVPMKALSDYGNTFDAEITSTTAGIQLTGITPGIAPVPEPESYALLLAGLGLIGAWRGRKNRRLA